MKRKRDMEVETEIKSAIQELSLLIKLKQYSSNRKSPSSAHTSSVVATTDNHLQEETVSYIPARPFLSICSSILQVLDKIGPTMAVLRQDIHKNIQRLEMFCESDPVVYSNLVEILKKEAVDRNAKKGDSCSKALVWLTRSLDFTAALLQKLVIDPRESMDEIVSSSYDMTLKPWHGWISAAAYKVALKLVPDTDTFTSLLMAKGENLDILKDDIQALLSLLVPLLEDLHSTLRSYGVERLKST